MTWGIVLTPELDRQLRDGLLFQWLMTQQVAVGPVASGNYATYCGEEGFPSLRDAVIERMNAKEVSA